eukprot:Phypoly_transcript_04190.p1 GENE.Phypoly_transcript_04190~~Phypoly_transcript_04190.p1  ORF type:complete len:732 (+),score=177.63 Phypoly_transcript_04190:129-2198(+)
MKLVNAKMLEVIFTNDGKQYLTPKQLELEIQDEILRSGGRINVIDLPPLLNVDSSHVEKKVETILSQDKDLTLVDGEIISSFYADRIVAEISEGLAESGQVVTQTLGARFGLGTAFLEKILTKKIASGKLKAHLQNGILYTNVFVERHKAKVRGLFSAATRPVHLKTVIDKYGLQEDLTYSALSSLIASGELAGYQSGKKLYTPLIFEHARTNYITSFFNSNSFIAYSALDKLDIGNPKEEICRLFPDGIALDSTYVSQSFIDIIEADVAEALSSDSFIDVSANVSAPLTDSDFTKVIEKLPCMNQKPAPTSFGKYVVSNGFLERCVKLFEQDIKDEIEKKGVQKPAPEPAKPKNTEPEEDEWEEKGKGKGKKRGAKKEPAKSAPKGGKEKESKGPDEAVQKLVKWFPQAESDMLYGIANHLKGTIAAIRTKLEQTASAVPANREKHEAVTAQLGALMLNILLFEKACTEISEVEPPVISEADVAQLQKHLLKTLCTDVANIVARDLAQQYKINLPASPALSATDKSTLFSQLPPATAKSLEKLFTLLTKQSVDDFITALGPLAEECQLQLVKKLDKKKESQLLQMHTEDLTKQLRDEKNPAAAFHQAVLIMYIRCYAHLVHAPPKNIQLLVARLQQKLPKKAFDKVKDFQNGVVRFLTAKTPADKESEEEKLTEKLDELKELALNLGS